MNNIEKYNQIFCELFSLEEGFDGAGVKLNDTPDWDSVGHMELITRIEDVFDIMLEVEDVLGLVSYTEGISILKKYGVEI